MDGQQVLEREFLNAGSMRLLDGMQKVRGSNPLSLDPRGLHVSVRPIFTFGSEFRYVSWHGACRACSCPCGGFLCSRGGSRACCRRRCPVPGLAGRLVKGADLRGGPAG